MINSLRAECGFAIVIINGNSCFKTKTTMKKTYINPSMEIVKINATSQLLSGSGIETGGTPGEEYTSTDVSYSRGFDFDDEEDW